MCLNPWYEAGELLSVKNFRDFDGSDTDAFVKIAYEKNALGRVTEIEYTDHADETSAGTLREKYTMAYDSRGYITDEVAYTNYASASTQHKQYEYDDAGRLTTYRSGPDADNPTDVRFYGYDNVGNRRTVTTSGETTTYNYDQLGRLLNTKDANQVDLQTFSYDDRGNQEIATVETGLEQSSTVYKFGLRDTLTKATITGYNAGEENNLYNASGQRVKRIEDAVVTDFFYTGTALLFTANADRVLLTENILDPNGQIVAGARFGSGVIDAFYFYNYDTRGSVTSIIAPTGVREIGYMYDAFGNEERSGSPSFLNDVTFTGSVKDESTGLQYMNARYYDPDTGRFISQDTYLGTQDNPQTQNLYSYCRNNPTNYVDPTGNIDTEDDPASVSARKDTSVVPSPHMKCTVCGLNGHNQKNCPEKTSGSRPLPTTKEINEKFKPLYNNSYSSPIDAMKDFYDIAIDLTVLTGVEYSCVVYKDVKDYKFYSTRKGIENFIGLAALGDINALASATILAGLPFTPENRIPIYVGHTHPVDVNNKYAEEIFSALNGGLGDATLVNAPLNIVEEVYLAIPDDPKRGIYVLNENGPIRDAGNNYNKYLAVANW